jgi:hypothetical protein
LRADAEKPEETVNESPDLDVRYGNGTFREPDGVNDIDADPSLGTGKPIAYIDYTTSIDDEDLRNLALLAMHIFECDEDANHSPVHDNSDNAVCEFLDEYYVDEHVGISSAHDIVNLEAYLQVPEHELKELRPDGLEHDPGLSSDAAVACQLAPCRDQLHPCILKFRQERPPCPKGPCPHPC